MTTRSSCLIACERVVEQTAGADSANLINTMKRLQLQLCFYIYLMLQALLLHSPIPELL
jgi:hypothetical protein